MKNLFSTHLARLQQTVQSLLENAFLDGLWIYAGKAKTLFLDDQTAPFKINPYFNYFFPYPQAENCWLFLDGKNKPKIYFYAPEDYWVSTLKVPTEAFFAAEFEWVLLRAENEIATFIQNPTACAFIGEDVELAKKLGFSHINPQKVLNSLNFARSIKTEFEIESIYQAQFSALKGHQVAKEAFFAGKSEFEINLEYLKATQQSDLNVPYGNIVAINQNGAVLHYTALDFDTHAKRHSFLIDAGTTVNGYASDLTRTYAFDSGSEFAELVAKMEQLKLQIIAELSIGVNYLHYHTRMQQMISQLLAEHQFIHLSAEQIFEQGISRTFFPHGLGHLLGIQVHDVGGFQQNARGSHKAPPEVYPSLRCTRELQENMVLTIEPGFYFIEMLLKPWKNSALSSAFNWQKIEAFKAFGGIRTEDNIVMRANGAENLTANAATTLGG